MPTFDDSGFKYASQVDRLGTSLKAERVKPRVQVEQTFTFNETEIKQILAQYVEDNYNKVVDVKDITGDYRQAEFHNQFDNSPGYCRFTVKVRG